MNDIELLAIWLHGVAQREGQLDVLRRIVRLAAENAAGMYGDEDELEVRALVGRFAAELDDLERQRREDDPPDGVPAVVRSNGRPYSDGTDRVHIHILRKHGGILTHRDGEREPVTLVVGGQAYRTHLQSRAGFPYIWVCPDMEDENGRVVRLGHVLHEAGLVRNQRLTLEVGSRRLIVHSR